MHISFKSAAIALTALSFFACSRKSAGEADWSVYGGDKQNTHYSSLKQINTQNVHQLKQAWVYRTGDADSMTQMQVNPLIINDTMYIVSPKLKLMALQAVTGQLLWTYDPVKDSNHYNGNFTFNVHRGLTCYTAADGSRRLFYSANSKLYCIDAAKGIPIQSFGERGRIHLKKDLGREVEHLYVACTTPGIIFKDLIIVGTRVGEEAMSAPGHIRAYDVNTGSLRWIFHTIPQPGEPGFESWEDSLAHKYIGGANAWSGFSMDEERGIVFVPTGSAAFDFYGGKRLGDNLFANCVLALDAATGKRIWHYQTVHHDVWDRDLPTAPVVLTLTKDGKKMDAVAQPTKSGYIFLLDRATGQPVYPITETAVPTETAITGEKLSPTQPIPSFPQPFARQILTEKNLNQHIPDSSYQDIKKRLSNYKTGHIFNPPSKEGTIIFPGFDGGAEWGGPAYDPETGIMYINANEMPWVLTMVDVKPGATNNETVDIAGRRIYSTHCMNCHGKNLEGAGNYPHLKEIHGKYDTQSLKSLLESGRRMMPSFKHLAEVEKDALTGFLLGTTGKTKEKFERKSNESDPYYQLPYNSTGYHKFLSREGYPAVAPPWGTLNAINLNTGKIDWQIPLGEYPELVAQGLHTGTENYGGPVVTAGGLIFIAATRDGKFRAYNKQNGTLLWQTDLPAPGFATPAVYMASGKQYVVIACGGGKLGTRGADAYVAFSLPD